MGYEFHGVTFDPWVGKRFGRTSRFGVGLLVLGESHYDPDSDCGFTTKIVKKWAQKKRHSFFTKISKVLLNRSKENWINDEERSEVWENIAFYNFAQSSVAQTRTPPTKLQWIEAQGPYKTVLNTLKPDAVLVLGRRLESHIQYWPENSCFETIVHPSSSHFSYQQSNPAFEKLLATARLRDFKG